MLKRVNPLLITTTKKEFIMRQDKVINHRMLKKIEQTYRGIGKQKNIIEVIAHIKRETGFESNIIFKCLHKLVPCRKNKLLTENDKEFIRQEYKSGVGFDELTERLGSVYTLRKILQESQLMKPVEVTEELKEALKLYLVGSDNLSQFYHLHKPKYKFVAIQKAAMELGFHSQHKLSAEQKERIKALHQAGLTPPEIQCIFNDFNKVSIYNALKSMNVYVPYLFKNRFEFNGTGDKKAKAYEGRFAFYKKLQVKGLITAEELETLDVYLKNLF